MKVDMSLKTPKMNYEKAEIAVIPSTFSDLLGIISERTRNLSPEGCQLNQFKLFCQIYSLIK